MNRRLDAMTNRELYELQRVTTSFATLRAVNAELQRRDAARAASLAQAPEQETHDDNPA